MKEDVEEAVEIKEVSKKLEAELEVRTIDVATLRAESAALKDEMDMLLAAAAASKRAPPKPPTEEIATSPIRPGGAPSALSEERWSKEEDQALMRAATKYGEKQWDKIAASVHTDVFKSADFGNTSALSGRKMGTMSAERSEKSCRDRYYQELKGKHAVQQQDQPPIDSNAENDQSNRQSQSKRQSDHQPSVRDDISERISDHEDMPVIQAMQEP